MTDKIEVGKDIALALVYCPKCQSVLTQSNLTPGAATRHRCRRCDEWVTVLVVAIPAEAVADPPPIPSTANGSALH